MRKQSALYFVLMAGSAGLGITSAGACTSSFQATGGGSSSSASSNATGGSTSTSGGGGGGGSGTCQASFPLADGAKVGDGCGVFVSATTGSSAGDGSIDQPFNSFADALKAANDKPIFLCGDFDESVTVRSSTDVYGGMSCPNNGDWTYNQKMRSTINGRPGVPTIEVPNTTAKFGAHSLAINASSSVLPGSSAIGVSIDKGVQAKLTSCEIVAGDGHDGADGKTPDAKGKMGVDGATSGSGAPSGSCPSGPQGGAGGRNVCLDGTTTGGDGGEGGDGTQLETSDPGMNGSPYVAGHNDGDGGGAYTDGLTCTDGHTGLTGGVGEAGAGGTDTVLAVGGVLGGAGHAGKLGKLGHGGGGGGGAHGGVGACPGLGANGGYGASGGGGGSGGCGGPGGSAPTAGGSSIALLVVGGTITVDHLTLTVGHAGKGGAGAAGQQGGDGGSGVAGGAHMVGTNAVAACNGGDGGQGGQGGPSGGARGGHAVCIAFGETPASTGFDATTHTGQHGDPGMGADGSDNGAAGVGGACWDFQKNKPCG